LSNFWCKKTGKKSQENKSNNSKRRRRRRRKLRIILTYVLVFWRFAAKGDPGMRRYKDL
jgi:hypothetical protein